MQQQAPTSRTSPVLMGRNSSVLMGAILVALSAMLGASLLGLASSPAHSAALGKARTIINGFPSGASVVKTGQRMTFKVRVQAKGATTKRRVKLQRKVAGSWKTGQMRRTNALGRATLTWRAPGRATTAKLRVVAPKTRRASEKTSRVRRVKVQAASTSGTVRNAGPSFEAAVFTLLNQARATPTICGGKRYDAVKPLRRNATLDQAARKHSQDMGKRGFFDHTNPDGQTPTDRARAEGYNGGVGENIAAGYPTAAAVMAGWLDSPGHCSNLMSGSYDVVGIGHAQVSGSRYGSYWTQNFG